MSTTVTTKGSSYYCLLLPPRRQKPPGQSTTLMLLRRRLLFSRGCVRLLHGDGRRVVMLAEKDVPPLSMKTLTTILANRMEAAPFLQEVLPVLMARMAVSMENAPTSLGSMPAMDALRDWYAESADEIANCEAAPSSERWRTRPSKTFEARERKFGDLLESIRSRGREVRDSLVMATSATGGLWRQNKEAQKEIDEFLISFYERRLTLRLLLGQYATCRQQQQLTFSHDDSYLVSTFAGLDANGDGKLDTEELAKARTSYARSEPMRGCADVRKASVCGLVDEAMSPFDVAVQAVADVMQECKMSQEFQEAPPFTMHGRGQGLRMRYLPRHLYKILRDLLRNAAHATLRKKKQASSSSQRIMMPPIRVIISDDATNDDVAIKVSDEAGGIPRSKVKNIFSFAGRGSSKDDKSKNFVSVLADQSICRALGRPEPRLSDNNNAQDTTTALLQNHQHVGGHGLPISRVYARYFEGDLHIRSMDGYGTDAYCYISRIADNELPT